MRFAQENDLHKHFLEISYVTINLFFKHFVTKKFRLVSTVPTSIQTQLRIVYFGFNAVDNFGCETFLKYCTIKNM